MRVPVAIIAGLAFSQPCAAEVVIKKAPAAQASFENNYTGDVTMLPGSVVTITLPEQFSTVVVGDPDLIDALVQNDKTFIVRAKAGGAGASNILVSGPTGQTIYNLSVRVTAGEGTVKVHQGIGSGTSQQGQGGGGRFLLHDFASYTCTTTSCVRLPQNQERITPPTTRQIISRDPGGPAPPTGQ